MPLILLSPYFGNLLENLALSEITKFFTNRGEQPEIYFVRSKEQVEIDFLLRLPNQRFIAIEVKVSPTDLTSQQIHLLDSLKLNLIDRWIISAVPSPNFAHAKVVCLDQIFDQLEKCI
jgi:predicted AAA+ superfamily ATPase